MMAEKKPRKARAVSKSKPVKKTVPRKALPAGEIKIRKPRAKKVFQPPVLEPVAFPLAATAIESEGHFAESKYYAGPTMQKFEGPSFDFPAGYGQTQIVLMVRDPFWVFTYWELTQSKIDEIKVLLGNETFIKSRLILRVYNVDNWDYFDIDLNGMARDWYIKVPLANASYCVEIGYKTPDGKFVACARSNVVTTPLDRMSDVIDEQWMVPDWDKIYSLSGGFGIGKSSAEIRALMKKRLEGESASGWVSSMSSPTKPAPQRPFWMWVKTDLILYGATEPSATLTVQGKKVDLRTDGTFTMRFALPDGKIALPVEAIRDDGKERRSAQIKVERKSK
ncbi:MAG: DUF4912 domain-containing protein [Candidatus Margulisiibacteriota bacterium]